VSLDFFRVLYDSSMSLAASLLLCLVDRSVTDQPQRVMEVVADLVAKEMQQLHHACRCRHHHSPTHPSRQYLLSAPPQPLNNTQLDIEQLQCDGRPCIPCTITSILTVCSSAATEQYTTRHGAVAMRWPPLHAMHYHVNTYCLLLRSH